MGKKGNKNKAASMLESTDPEAVKVRHKQIHKLDCQEAGNGEYMKGNYVEAIKLYSRAIDLDG